MGSFISDVLEVIDHRYIDLKKISGLLIIIIFCLLFYSGILIMDKNLSREFL